MSVGSEIAVRVISNIVLIAISVMVISLSQKGFFFKFLRVKTSFGKFILVKISEINRDSPAVGQIVEGCLVFKYNKEIRRVKVPKDVPVIYKYIGVSCIDVDGEKNTIFTIEKKQIAGFDAVKYNDLYLRALYKPTIASSKEMIIIAVQVLTLVAVVIALVLIYKNTQSMAQLGSQVASIKSAQIVQASAI